MTPHSVPTTRNGRWWIERGLLVACILAMVGSGADQSGSPVWRSTFVVSAFGAAGLVGLAWYRDEVSSREVLVFAVLFRLLAFPLLPSLSDDGFRYVWDGWLQASGINPYLFRPMDEALAAFQNSSLYDRLNSVNYYSVYPPTSQLVFAIGGMAIGGGWIVSWYTIKFILSLTEIGGVWALSRMAPPRVVLLYAWHPLVVIEVAGQAHTEAGMVGLLLLSVLAYRSEHRSLSVAALTAAGWFKLYPLFLLPFLLRRIGWRYGWIAGGVSAALLLPYTAPSIIENIGESLDLYVRLFEFNAGPYLLLKQAGFVWTGEDISKALGPSLRFVFFLGLMIVFVLDYRLRWPLVWVWVTVIGLLWTMATTVHPWYLLGLLAMLPLTLTGLSNAAVRLHAFAWIWLSLATTGTYLFYTHGEGVYGVAVVLGWGGWACALGMALGLAGMPALIQYRAEKKWAWLRVHLGQPTQILDLGAGEGFVGASAARDTGADVVLADVVDFNQTTEPLVLYDGRHLPFPDQTFGATLLVFVLHHAENPQAVLREVRRVTRGRVGVIESVVEHSLDRRWLEFIDRFANRVRSGGLMRSDEEHLHFGTVDEWRAAFEAAGFVILIEARRGRRVHKQHLFILE